LLTGSDDTRSVAENLILRESFVYAIFFSLIWHLFSPRALDGVFLRVSVVELLSLTSLNFYDESSHRV
jgi:hypothetical protein